MKTKVFIFGCLLLFSLIVSSLTDVNYEQALFSQIVTSSSSNIIYSPFSLKMGTI